MKVLVVDDDPSVLQSLLAVLKPLEEFEVRPAITAEKALANAEAMGGVDLLVTDVIMEPTDGFTLRAELLARYPALRTVFISGYDLSEYGPQLDGARLLSKPLEIESLLEAMRGELANVETFAEASPGWAEEPVLVDEVVETESLGEEPEFAADEEILSAEETPSYPDSEEPLYPAAHTPYAAPPDAAHVPSAPRLITTYDAPAASGAHTLGAPRIMANPPPAEYHTASAEEQAATHTHSATSLSLLGQMIGGYQIVAQLGQGRWGPVFAANQVAINRPVGLKVLDPELAGDDFQRERFIADARAKANVQHPSILSVYEAGSADHWIYYTHEYVDGQSLADAAATGRKIDQPTALRLARVAAEGMLYFQKNTIPHSVFEAGDVYLSAEGQPRLANIATQLSDRQAAPEEEMETLGRALLALLPAGPSVTAGLRALLGRTQRSHSAPFPSWEALLVGIKALEPKIVPIEAAKISAHDRAAVRAVARARAHQRRSFLLNVFAMISLVSLAGAAVWFVFFRANERSLGKQIHIPGGAFISGQGTTSDLDEFWIDQYEISIGQYAKFVEWLEANPGEEHAYDHKRQPHHLSHTPQFWKIYYLNAVAQKTVHSVPQTLNSPAIMVTWWDAWAYAKWRGRDLPTALEWERAARGTKGRTFTWGDDPDPKKANTNADFIEKSPAEKGGVDGFNYWGEVDRQPLDKSAEGVFGLQGNVSEWTATWSADGKFPIIKGGNYRLGLQPLSARIADHEPTPGEEWIGFRTISRTNPSKSN